MNHTLLCLEGGSPTLLAGVVSSQGVLAQEQGPAQVAHGVALLDMVDRVMRQAGITPTDLGGIAVGAGPGSFTGLRTCLATAKGLALGWNLPLFGVSTLHALARSTGAARGAVVCAATDARKGEVYAALFHLGATAMDDVTLLEPWVGPAATWAPHLAAHPHAVLAGDAWEKYATALTGQPTVTPAWSLPQPTLQALHAVAVGQAPSSLVGLEPHYVRKSYVELSLGPPTAPTRTP